MIWTPYDKRKFLASRDRTFVSVQQSSFPDHDFHEKVVYVKPDVAGIPHAAGASFRCSLHEIGFL